MLKKKQALAGKSRKSKINGAYSNQLRSLSRQLVILGVSSAQVPKVIRICTTTFGIHVGNIPSSRSVGRFVTEGGIAAKIQAGNILSNADGITTSMDSTSQRNINYSSMHLMANTAETHNQLYLLVESTTNHTSKTQVEVLKNAIHSCKSSPKDVLHAADVARRLYGANGDHANDQLKVAQLEKQWKADSWVEYLGSTCLRSMGETDAESFCELIHTRAESKAGGSEDFAKLEITTQRNMYIFEYKQQVWELGSIAYKQAPPTIQADMSCLNIVNALKCPATLLELIVITLYGQMVSKPYMRLVRTATVEGKGLADLASLHTHVQDHLKKIIDNPQLLFGPDAAINPLTLDGFEQDEQEIVATLQRHESVLPRLQELFVAFCSGSLKTWIRFTDEFLPGGALSSMSTEQANKAFMPPTNDANEGALGTWRVWTRRFPRLTQYRFNAIMMNQQNHTEEYIEKNMTTKQLTWMRAEAQEINSSNQEATRMAGLVAASKLAADEN
ncbi:unnamed protein product [Rhizoctonia solani]|uniref:Uncharacterized protein n=1 Tax=Rhizoctonia solani TaxID=456999 RepID=A0A8H3GB00_9AGAM|nr:unnamed protein product [Rhizoctonia solani]